MCEVMERYSKEAIKEENINRIKKMILQKYSKKAILRFDYTEEEYLEAKKEHT